MTDTRMGRTAVDADDEIAQTIDEREFGFWLYLMSDAIVFGLLFATYAVMSGNSQSGSDGRELFSLGRAFGETMVLLVSSLTFGLASVALEMRKSNRAHAWLGLTFFLGLVFVGLELSEFSGLILAGAGPDSNGRMSAFFALLGAHGLHVLMGLFWIVILSVQLRIDGPTINTQSRLRRLGLFWHFLAIVWIGIYSVVYLPAMV